MTEQQTTWRYGAVTGEFGEYVNSSGLVIQAVWELLTTLNGLEAKATRVEAAEAALQRIIDWDVLLWPEYKEKYGVADGEDMEMVGIAHAYFAAHPEARP